MKITLAKHGGFAAGIHRPPRILDSATLPEQDAAELARLVADVRTAPAPAGDAIERARDAMSYTITVEEDDGSQTVLRQSDVTMTPPFASLIDWIRRHSPKA